MPEVYSKSFIKEKKMQKLCHARNGFGHSDYDLFREY